MPAFGTGVTALGKAGQPLTRSPSVPVTRVQPASASRDPIAKTTAHLRRMTSPPPRTGPGWGAYGLRNGPRQGIAPHQPGRGGGRIRAQLDDPVRRVDVDHPGLVPPG